MSSVLFRNFIAGLFRGSSLRQITFTGPNSSYFILRLGYPFMFGTNQNWMNLFSDSCIMESTRDLFEDGFMAQ